MFLYAIEKEGGEMKSFFGTMHGTKQGGKKHHLQPKDRRTTLFAFSIHDDHAFPCVRVIATDSKKDNDVRVRDNEIA